MTLQIGLVARDGFVLASDRKAVKDFRTLPLQRGRTPLASSSKIRKILVATNMGLVCAFSGSDLSMVVAQGLVDSCPKQFDSDAEVQIYLRETSQSIISRGKNPERELIIAAIPNAKSVSRLWRLIFTPDINAEPIYDKILGGDEANPAVYITERYYQEMLSVEELKLLSAHFILEGHALRPSSITGLDIFVSKDGGESRFLDDNEKQALEERSAAIHAQSREKLFKLRETST